MSELNEANPIRDAYLINDEGECIDPKGNNREVIPLTTRTVSNYRGLENSNSKTLITPQRSNQGQPTRGPMSTQKLQERMEQMSKEGQSYSK